MPAWGISLIVLLNLGGLVVAVSYSTETKPWSLCFSNALYGLDTGMSLLNMLP
jgi:hypothetical protein